MNFRLSLIVLGVLLWITVACATLPSTDAPEAGQSAGSPQVNQPTLVLTQPVETGDEGSPTPAGAVVSPTVAVEVPAVTEIPEMGATVVPNALSADEIEARVRADLSSHLNLEPAQIETVAVETRTWMEGVSSCAAQKGMLETPQPAPGWLILLRANGSDYEYRVAQDGQFIRCTPVSKPIDPIR